MVEDTPMEVSRTPEIGDSRKRSFDSAPENEQTKRSHFSSENNKNFHYGDSMYHMKILVPSLVSGSIIGKGGEIIATLQKETGARLNMSKSNDFYPGTMERVCLISGTVDSIMKVIDFVMDKLYKKPEMTTKVNDANSKQMQIHLNILVPNSTAGMIIGKGGAYINRIKEESGTYVQISQKPTDIALQERCITVFGDKESNKHACEMILSKIVEDPYSGICLNVSYADVNGPVANFKPTGSPYATDPNAIKSNSANQSVFPENSLGINLSLNFNAPNTKPNMALVSKLLDHIKGVMCRFDYSENDTMEICDSLKVLAKHGVLGMDVGVPHMNGSRNALDSFLSISPLDQQIAAAKSTGTNNFKKHHN